MNTKSPLASRSATLNTVGFAALLACIAPAVAQDAGPAAPAVAHPYHVLRTFDVGGEGGWDYLTMDSDGHRLFVSRSTHVMVIDTETGKVVGDIPDTEGVHGIALAPEFNRGFTSNGRAGTATIFDLKTLAVIGSVKTGQNPDAILYDPATKRVFTFNGASKDATAIDAATGKVAGTIPLEGKPESGASDGQGHVFVNLEDKSEVVSIDPKELKVIAHWPLAPGKQPSGMAIDLKNHRLFVGCGGSQTMAVVDFDSGKVLAALPTGKGVDANGFDPGTACAFSSNGDGTLTVVHEDDPSKFTVAENATTAPRAKTMTLDPKTHLIYLGAAKYEAAAQDSGGRRARPKMIAGSFQILVVGT
jgi:DNA-binding beta-propeller fold protein YncE